MIVIPSESGLTSRFSIPSVESIGEHSEDDIHQCGACKRQFTDIFLFMRHKSENNCSSRPSKKTTKVTVPTSLLIGGGNTPLMGDSSCTSNPETKYTRVTLLNTGGLKIPRDGVLKNGLQFSPSDPPPLVITNRGSQKLGLQNFHETSIGTATDGGIFLESDWDSAWSASKVLGLPNSFKQFPNQQLSVVSGIEGLRDTGESSANLNIENINNQNLSFDRTTVLTLPNGHILDNSINFGEENQAADNLTDSAGILLDVDDEVATLLASHLADDTSLEIYPNTSDTLLTLGQLQSQFGIPTSAVQLPYVNTTRDGVKSTETEPIFEKIVPQNGKSVTSNKSLKVPMNTQKDRKTKTDTKKKDPRIYKCRHEGCIYRAISSRDLLRHQRTHTGEKPFRCTACDKAFTRADKLRIHMKVHSNADKPFQCEFCDFSSRERGGLTVHMRKHTDERPFKCQLCDHSSRTQSHLRVHLRKHTGDHPFKCDICGNAYTTSSDLTRHSKIHLIKNGEKPFSCQHCRFSCNFKTSLKAHIDLNHGPNVNLSCPICGVVCATRIDIRNHIKVHQDDPKFCKLCDVICSTTEVLNKHLKRYHSDSVKEGPPSKSKKSNLKDTVHKRKKKSPTRLKHVTTDNFDIYNCRYCPESFYREDALEEHIRQHQLEELTADPILAFCSDSTDSIDSNSMDVTCGLADLVAMASHKDSSAEQQLLYSGALRNAEILASLNRDSTALPEYIDQTDPTTLSGALFELNCPLGALAENDNGSSLLC